MTVTDDPALTTSDLVLTGTTPLPEYLRHLPTDQLLDLLDDAADADIREGQPPNTKLAYASDWGEWQKFAHAMGIDPLTVRSGLFYAFVKYLEHQGSAPATIERRLYGTLMTMRGHGLAVTGRDGPAAKARARIKQYKIELLKENRPLGSGKARGIRPEEIRRICTRVRPDIMGLRDKAILLIGVHIGARRSELANLLDSDIVDDPEGRGMEITVRVSKGGKGRTVAMPFLSDENLCPVSAWRAWRQEAGINGGPAFCQIRGRLRPYAVPGTTITPQLAGQTVTKLGKLLDLDLHLTGHSLRRGRVTALWALGVDVADICEITGHSPKSGTVYEYREVLDRWNNGALRDHP